MATVTFASTDPQAEIQALIAVLGMWLKELPEQTPRPARARYSYADNGGVTLVVEVEEAE